MGKKPVSRLRLWYHSFQRDMNNRKIKTKTIYLYLFCVLVPVVVTNTFVIGSILGALHQEAEENMNNITDSVAMDITSALESAVYVTIDLYTSDAICSFLDHPYKNSTEYFQAYNRVFENYVFYASSKHLISGITMYSDNDTMISGGRYFRVDSVRSDPWYEQFTKTGEDLFVYPYYYNTQFGSNRKRMLSVIRKLNYVGTNDIEKLVKLDLNYSKLNEYINKSSFDTTVYVCHGGKVVFSNDKKMNNPISNFSEEGSIPMERIQLQKKFSSYGLDFDVYLMGYKSDYISRLKNVLWVIAMLFLADALIPAAMLTIFSNSITKRVLLLGKYLRKLKEENFEVIQDIEGKDEIGELLENYNLMAVRMKNLIEYEYKSKLEQQELHLARQQAELQALYSQINPHFMFNVLESIRMRSVIKGEEETAQMVNSLARLMRKSAEWGTDLITIEQEAEFTEDYLKLQQYRFGDNFHYRFRISKECYHYKIPSLVLVTLAENSCVHGLDRGGHSGSIFLSIYEEGSYLYIEVEDTGVGMPPEQVLYLEKLLNNADISDLHNSNSLGLLNACIRLKKYCGNDTKIIIESEEQAGTCISIVIPVRNAIRDK